MWLETGARALLVALSALLMSACGSPSVPTADQMNASYEEALARTAPVAVDFSGDAAADRRVLAGVEGFFGDMDPATVRDRAAAVYAPGAYLNDNITVVEGAGGIGEYFAHTLRRVQGLQVTFLDVAYSGPDCFVRWRMSVEARDLNDGKPIVSYGMTHFRFDARGRVLIHKDFWDAGTGLYEYLPGLRSVLPRVRAAAEDTR